MELGKRTRLLFGNCDQEIGTWNTSLNTGLFDLSAFQQSFWKAYKQGCLGE
jgi:hypothetical protein